MARTPEQLEELAKVAAHRIVTAFGLFKDEDVRTQQLAQQIIMQRVQRMIAGENVILEGEGLVTVIDEAGQTEPINTQERKGDSPEAV